MGSSGDQPLGNILPPRRTGGLSSRSSDGSLSSSSPATSSDYEYPRLSCLSNSRLQDSGISSSSSVDSLSCLLSTLRMRNTTRKEVRQQKFEQQEQLMGSRHLKREFDRVKTHSRLASGITSIPAG